MAIEITDDGATIKARDTSIDKDLFFNKRKANIKRVDQKILIQDDRQLFEFLFSDVTIPLEANAAALAAVIETMLETPSGFDGAMVISGSPSTASVNNTSSIIVPANVDRNWISITNLGSKNVFLALGEDAIVNRGIGLVQNLGEIEFRAIDIGIEAIHAITTSGAAATIAFLETSK